MEHYTSANQQPPNRAVRRRRATAPQSNANLRGQCSATTVLIAAHSCLPTWPPRIDEATHSFLASGSDHTACRSDPLVRLNGSLRQENLDGAAPTPPKFAILLKEEV